MSGQAFKMELIFGSEIGTPPRHPGPQQPASLAPGCLGDGNSSRITSSASNLLLLGANSIASKHIFHVSKLRNAYEASKCPCEKSCKKIISFLTHPKIVSTLFKALPMWSLSHETRQAPGWALETASRGVSRPNSDVPPLIHALEPPQ